MSGTFNFQNLPKDPGSNLPQVGPNKLIIKKAEKVISSTQSTMLVVEHTVPGFEKITITDRYVLFDQEGEPIQFSQYRLRRLLEATNTIPEGDFTIPVIGRMLEGKSYVADLVEEEYNGRTYVKIGSVDTFQPVAGPDLAPSTAEVTKDSVKIVPGDKITPEHTSTVIESSDDDLI